MNPLNTRFNKASWSAAASALITLVNGRLPTDVVALDATEQGLLMTIVTFVVVLLVPNAKPSDA